MPAGSTIDIDSGRMSENYAVHICRTATCKAMKRTGIMVLLSSHSSGWNRDHATGAAAGDPRGGERPMELKAFSRLMTSRSLGCRGQISEKEMNVTPPALLGPAVIHIQTFL